MPVGVVGDVQDILDELDLVLIMTVNPGFAGQEFIESVIPKIVALRKIIDQQDKKILIEVDGGVKLENAGRLAEAGVDVFVAGSAIFGTKDYAATIAAFRRQIEVRHNY